MRLMTDRYHRQIRFTDEREQHLVTTHPEMVDQIAQIEETLVMPDTVVQSNSAVDVEMFYRFYQLTPVNAKYLCVVVKLLPSDGFIITAYFTDKIKKGTILWLKS